jgi:LCP family protein required for cell wall assembly
MDHKRKTALRILLFALGLPALALLALLSLYFDWEEAPALPASAPALRVEAPPQGSGDTLPVGERIPTSRQNGVYTILLAGSDDGNGNTDTLILARLDTLRHHLDLVSIPRDTLINVPWEVRKLNSVYWGARLNGGDGLLALKTQVGRLTGFEPDCCAVADLDLFTQAVDLIGGIYFDVPADMDYEDAGQGLWIHLKAGYQLLNGAQATGLCRYRSGYAMGDLGRIEVQQRFLQAAAEQLLSMGNLPRAPELIELLAENLDTDLSAANLAFLLRQTLQCKKEDICFFTAPSHPETISGYSYAVLNAEDWLALVNQRLNPYADPIGLANVDLVYRRGDRIVGSAELRDAAYYAGAPDAAEFKAP